MMDSKECGRTRSCPILRYYYRISVKILRKTSKHFSLEGRFKGRDSNQVVVVVVSDGNTGTGALTPIANAAHSPVQFDL
jgi:hypothetical protein